MNRLEIINFIQNLKEEDKIYFSIGDEKLNNRFDKEDKNQYTKGDIKTDLAFFLYSYVANAIFFKAQGKEKQEEGYHHFDIQLEELIQKQTKDIFDNNKVIKDDAMRMLSAFFSNKEDITLIDLFEKFAPLCVLNLSLVDPSKTKKIYRTYNKNKDILFNQATLFIRNLNHSFLSQKNIDPLDIKPDLKNLSNGVFIYQDKNILFPTWQNAFTLESFKKVAQDGLLSYSNGESLDCIKKISVIYLAKGFIASYSF